MDKVAGSGNDEFYTPKYAITPIIKYLKQKKYNNIWCPFDTEDSLFVKILKDEGFKVINTHIEQGDEGDFFKINPHGYDCIVSNPPYSLKNEVFERLFKLNKPFMMLVGVVGLFESQRRFELFKNNSWEILYFNKRIDFFKDFDEIKPSKNPPFSTVYVTKDVLPEKICFDYLNKKIIK